MKKQNPYQSRVLQKLRNNESATGYKINFADPRVVEVISLTGVDAVWLCHEHVPNDWLMLENQIRAAQLYGVDSIVRISKGSYSDYIRPFEAGATGIMVPHVTTADEARQVVSMTRFRALGKRAIDGGNRDALFCNLSLSDYIQTANKDRFIIIQIESPEAVDAVESIAAVEGYDILLFGAGDYAHLTGNLDNPNCPEVTQARQRVAKAARQNGKWAMSAGLPVPRQQLEDEGFSFFILGADVVSLGNAVKASVQNFGGGSSDKTSPRPCAGES